jgi:hypothetical protein
MCRQFFIVVRQIPAAQNAGCNFNWDFAADEKASTFGIRSRRMD